MSKLTSEIQQLAKMHIIYRMETTPRFTEQKNYIMSIILSAGINTRKELDPVTFTLFHRYFTYSLIVPRSVASITSR